MRTREFLRGVVRSWGLVLLVTAACASSRDVPEQLGGESHFLRRCEAECGAGLDCIQGLCTRGCVVGKDRCDDLSTGAECTADSVEPGQVAVCDLGCASTAECAGLSPSHRCEDGFCRAPELASVDAGSASVDAGSSGPPYPTDHVFACPSDVAGDSAPELVRAVVQADSLTFSLRYGGGCAQHTFALCYLDAWDESYPVQVGLRLIHDAHGDTCDALLTSEHRFDLKPLAQAYESRYQHSAGLIETSYGLYAFGALSCEDRLRGAAGQVADFEVAVSRACSSATDCTWADNSTSCHARCGTVASNEGAAEFAEWLATTSASVCGNYQADGCGSVLIPPCAPPGPLTCVAGQCQEQP